MATKRRFLVPRLEPLERLVCLAGYAIPAGSIDSATGTPARFPVADVDDGSAPAVTDPDLVKEGDTYYLFSSGPGIEILSSTDMVHWTSAGSVFPQAVPAWAAAAVPGSTSIWGPDVSFFGGQYHLYYAVSTYGSQRSVIGLATNTTLDPTNPAYRWVDHEPVISSSPGDRFNAIDPNVLVDGSGRVWLTFGSRWAGIQQIRLDPATGMPLQSQASRATLRGREVRTVAARPDGVTIEAPFLFQHGGDDYLFVSVGSCCVGDNSTYEILVGRSTSPSGPFLDRSGRPMTRGGGTLVLGSGGRLIGPGSASVLADGSGDWIVFQGYERSDPDQPVLQVRRLTWTARGWPVVGAEIKPV
jgi:arabinan endo-1,5-alpha-L-arabinosidase